MGASVSHGPVSRSPLPAWQCASMITAPSSAAAQADTLATGLAIRPARSENRYRWQYPCETWGDETSRSGRHGGSAHRGVLQLNERRLRP